MRENLESSSHESESNIDMNSKEAMEIMQRMEYTGSQELSKTQLRKKRREVAKNFIKSAMTYPQWKERLDEIWIYNGKRDEWKLKD